MLKKTPSSNYIPRYFSTAYVWTSSLNKIISLYTRSTYFMQENYYQFRYFFMKEIIFELIDYILRTKREKCLWIFEFIMTQNGNELWFKCLILVGVLNPSDLHLHNLFSFLEFSFISYFVFFQASQKRRWWNVGRISLLFRFHGFYRANPASRCGRTGVILGYSVSLKTRESMAVFVENRSRSRIQSTSLSHDHGIHLLHGPR